MTELSQSTQNIEHTENTECTGSTNRVKSTEITDSVYWIWFQLVFGVGSLRAEMIMNYYDNPKQIYDSIKSNVQSAGALSQRELEVSDAAMKRAAEIKQRTLKKGVDIITPDSEDYPELLRQIYSKPSVLYVKGDLTCLKDKLAIAMVGTRKHTEYGKEAAAWLAKGLVKGDAVVISGLAHGIDTESHMAALMAGGKSIGVLGCGIDVDYPKGNAKVKRLMCENGAVVSEFPLGTEPRAGHFPIRNRIISGMSHGTVVVEAEVASGSLITARHAYEQGRDIFAVPGSIFSAREQGTHLLIQDGAKLVNSAQDIFNEYRHIGFWKCVEEKYDHKSDAAISYSAKAPMKNGADENRIENQKPAGNKIKKQEAPAGLSNEACTVYDVINDNLVTVDAISEITGLPISKILSALTELEIYGLIQGYPGRKFGIIYI